MTSEALLLTRLEPLLAASVEDLALRSPGVDAELSLRSIEVITLVDLLEADLGVVLTSDDVRPEHFATRRSIAKLLATRHAGGA